jgi:hypothetical protein
VEFFKDQAAIVTFVVLFIPGFVSTRVFDLLVPGHQRDYGKAIYEVVGYSFVTYAIWSPALLPIYLGYQPPLWVAVALAAMILLVTPAALPLLYLTAVRRWLASKVVDPCPSAWDWSFSKNPTAMLLVHLRDGRKVGGTWDRTAFSSSYPVPPDLYLSEAWNVNQDTGTFESRVQNSRGLFLLGSDIEMLEFFNLDEIRRQSNAR